MPVVLPEALRPYRHHGVQFTWKPGDKDAVAVCFKCGREGKMGINVEKGTYNCFVCGQKGNAISFINWLWDDSDKATLPNDLKELATNRKLLYPETLTYWGICKSTMTDDWLIPGYSTGGKLAQLYRYIKDKQTGKFRLIPTPTLQHHLHGVNLLNKDRSTIYICEGVWDGLAFWEVLRAAKRGDDGLTLTGVEANSLLADANVVAIPGIGTVGEPFIKWLPLFEGKKVVLMFDSDHAKMQGERLIPSAGFAATKRAVKIFTDAEAPPEKIEYLYWGPEGFDPKQPSGFDTRDYLGKTTTISNRVSSLTSLLAKVVTIPDDWLGTSSSGDDKGGRPELECLPCSDWKTLTNAWRKAMRWFEGLDRALSVMLASCASTETVGEQLWLKIIGPASCGKSTLCEALSTNKKYTLAKSTIRGFHSGFQTDKKGEQDNSLISLVKNRTLITKDGDTLLQSPNLPQILAEGRDVYDRTSRTHYRNAMSRDYENVNMTWLLCGTSSLRSIDSSELGERFLDCVIIDKIDEDEEDDIGWRVANRTDREAQIKATTKHRKEEDHSMVHAKQLTGGYIDYLRANVHDLVKEVVFPEPALRQCQRLAKFIAYMRARPSTKQQENAEREMSYRLISQLVRLAKFLAVVLNRKEVDGEVLRRITKVALDTARGLVLEIVSCLYKTGTNGAATNQILIWTGHAEEQEKKLLNFLRRIGAVEKFVNNMPGGVTSKPRWRLSPRIMRLYEQVVKVDAANIQ